MKTKLLILGAIVTAFTCSTFAGDSFLSPRAKDNQIMIANSSTAAPASAVAAAAATSPKLLSPRVRDNQIKVVVSGVSNDRNPYLECRSVMTGSPKAVAACADNPNHPACNAMTVAQAK